MQKRVFYVFEKFYYIIWRKSKKLGIFRIASFHSKTCWDTLIMWGLVGKSAHGFRRYGRTFCIISIQVKRIWPPPLHPDVIKAKAILLVPSSFLESTEETFFWIMVRFPCCPTCQIQLSIKVFRIHQDMTDNHEKPQCVKGPFLGPKTTNSWKTWKMVNFYLCQIDEFLAVKDSKYLNFRA